MMLKDKKFLTRFSLLLLAAGLLITATACDTNPTEESSENFADSSISESSEIDASSASSIDAIDKTDWHTEKFYWEHWAADGYILEIELDIPAEWELEEQNYRYISQYIIDSNGKGKGGSFGITHFLNEGQTLEDLAQQAGEYPIRWTPEGESLLDRKYLTIGEREYLLEKTRSSDKADPQKLYRDVVTYEYYFAQDGIVGLLFFGNRGDKPENELLFIEILKTVKITVIKTDAE